MPISLNIWYICIFLIKKDCDKGQFSWLWLLPGDIDIDIIKITLKL